MGIECLETFDDENDDEPVIRLFTKANECQRPAIMAPCSVFDLAVLPIKPYKPESRAKSKTSQNYAGRVFTDDGVTRVAGGAYPLRSDQESLVDDE